MIGNTYILVIFLFVSATYFASDNLLPITSEKKKTRCKLEKNAIKVINRFSLCPFNCCMKKKTQKTFIYGQAKE